MEGISDIRDKSGSLILIKNLLQLVIKVESSPILMNGECAHERSVFGGLNWSSKKELDRVTEQNNEVKTNIKSERGSYSGKRRYVIKH